MSISLRSGFVHYQCPSFLRSPEQLCIRRYSPWQPLCSYGTRLFTARSQHWTQRTCDAGASRPVL